MNFRPRPVVLVVVDEEDTRAMYALVLSALGFDVTTADTAARGQARASDICPDIIVADVAPRRGDGWALLRSLRCDPRTRDIPVVVVAPDASPAARERAAREGCAALCVKSCPLDKLAIGLRAVLEQRARADHARAKRPA